MKIPELKKLVLQGESDCLEFKKSTAQLKSAAETLCGFLNGKGGMVLLGVTDQGGIVGQLVSDKTKQEIAGVLHKFQPSADIKVTYVNVSVSKKMYVIILEAQPEESSVPYLFDGRAYERYESTTVVMTRERYHQLWNITDKSDEAWENLPAKGVFFEDLDHEEILNTIHLGSICGRISNKDMTKDPKEALIHMRLIDNGKICNSAVVLYSKKFPASYAHCMVKMARFKGDTKDEFIDSKQIEGHAFFLLSEMTRFVNFYIPVASRFGSETLQRIDTPLYPFEAVREACVNAIAHRNYNSLSGAISVAIYDNKIEIWNDGGLLPGMQLSDLKKTHDSKPRNKNISRVLYRCQVLEEWGRGTLKIVEYCVRNGNPEPEFFEQGGSFCVRFFARKDMAQTEKLRFSNAQQLTFRQMEILKILKTMQSGDIQEIMSLLSESCSKRTLNRELSDLKSLGMIKSTGQARAIRWSIHGLHD